MIPKISRYAIIILFIVALSILLPSLYWMIFDKPIQAPMVFYSSIKKGFLFSENRTGNESEYFDNEGNTYDRKTFRTLLPLSYYSDLLKWNILPDNIDGIPISYSIIRNKSLNFSFEPKDLNTPIIDLYPLFESQSDFARLELPGELFRVGTSLEFIDAETNKIITAKSQEFTQALHDAGFQFPAKYIAGNPTTRKPFDEGYFIIDAANSVYHLKQIKGKPFCVNTGISSDLNIRFIKVQENSMKEYYGAIVTKTNEIYLIRYNNYSLTKLPVDGYIADEMTFRLQCNPIYRMVKYYDDKGLTYTVMDSNYNYIDTYQTCWTPREEWTSSKIAAIVFPFSIERKSGDYRYIKFKFVFTGKLAFIGILLGLIITLFLKVNIYHEKLRDNWFDFVIVLFSGLFGTLAVLLIRPEPWD